MPDTELRQRALAAVNAWQARAIASDTGSPLQPRLYESERNVLADAFADFAAVELEHAFLHGARAYAAYYGGTPWSDENEAAHWEAWRKGQGR